MGILFAILSTVLGLNFGLFQAEPLQQDTGVLSQRWNQDGSVIKNLYAQNFEDDTLYTVTTGKTLYVTTIIIAHSEPGEGTCSLTLFDLGTQKATMFVEEDDQIVMQFDTPLYFDNTVFIGSNCEVDVTVIGWEE